MAKKTDDDDKKIAHLLGEGPKSGGQNAKSSQTVAAQQLRSLIERIERLNEERKTIGDDIKEVFAEAKGNGFDTKIMRKIIALRKKDLAERQEEEALLDVYMAALGMIDGDDD
jgi:uncharacterized protein (UPF0335 family)